MQGFFIICAVKVIKFLPLYNITVSLRKEYLIPLLTVFLLIAYSGTAQKFLAIDKSGKIKRLRFYINDKINIRLQDENFFRSGYIDAIEDTSFIFDGKNIPLSRVDAMLVYKNKGGHALIKEASGKLPVAGIFLLAVTAVNSLINSSYPLIPVNMYLICGGMVVTGFLLHPLTYRVYKAKKHPLRIIDVTVMSE